eukprot:TRINITY_DN13044_c0_g1_i9.p1 TRINITY_DN13044_c0_g1~~TRINITY_DN13044_c0_g1_i9.p1  ORF type:complete len:156 (-),score=45.12 TRINITY_DN13044_c0_g1_i9:7-474(-)
MPRNKKNKPPEPLPVENPNLAVLKRKDASLLDIIATSGHVVVYRFASGAWEKKNVEGPLFVVSRSRAPFYRIVVLNRQTLHNLVEDVSTDFQMEKNGPYLMYANAKGETHGLWFPEEASLETCLLYTSDAADEEDSGDLGGSRNMKKKKKRSKRR